MRNLVLFSLAIVLLGSCIKKKMGATITGKVVQFDQYGKHETSDLDHVTVNVKGYANSTTTDKDGNYTLTGLPSGTFDVLFSRPGYGQWQKQNVIVSEGGTYNIQGYSLQIPQYTFTGIIYDTLSVSNPSSTTSYVNFNLQMNSSPKGAGMLVIRSEDPGLDLNNPSSYSYLKLTEIKENTSACQYRLSKPFSAGTYYYKVYPYPYVNAAGYFYHASTKKDLYYAAGTQLPGTFSVTVP